MPTFCLVLGAILMLIGAFGYGRPCPATTADIQSAQARIIAAQRDSIAAMERTIVAQEKMLAIYRAGVTASGSVVNVMPEDVIPSKQE